MRPPLDEPLSAPQLLHAEQGVYFAPIRHHSPACAHALRAMLREIRPRQVLIEAPSDFDTVLEVLLDPALRPPVAVAAFREAGDETAVTSYYPLSRHAPEMVALLEANALGAVVRFIDMPSSMRLERERAEPGVAPAEPRSLAAEPAFSANDYVAALCVRAGCRDQNELWDHLFESRIGTEDWRTFFRDVGAYCGAVRATIPERQLVADHTVAREQHMVAVLQATLSKREATVVVTGGLHTPALIRSLTELRAPPDTTQITPPSNGKVYVVRYGFRELDRLNGYASGLPMPGYYDYIWKLAEAGGSSPLDWRQATARLLSDFADGLRRDRSPLVPGVPALANALEASARLAQLRGRPGPLRTDLLDAVLSTCVKGETSGGADPLLAALVAFLQGSALGDVPPSAGSPPLVEHVRRRARAHGFELSFASQQRRKLDIYRSEGDLAASRFLHAMTLLGTGFAARLSGPDPISGAGRPLLFETWTASWSPMVEARLVELSRYGNTLEAAALAETRRMVKELRQGRRDASAVVELLMRACLAGLQEYLAELIIEIDLMLSEDPEIGTVARALSDLFLAWRARELLGLVGRADVEHLVGTAYRRALELAAELDHVKVDRQLGALEALATIRQVVVSAAKESHAIDPELFEGFIDASLAAPWPPLLMGAITALAFLAGRVDAAELAKRISGFAGGAQIEAADNVAAIRGVAALAPELLARVPELISGLDEVVTGMDDDQFIAHLPHLRLAFAALNPRETDAVASLVAELHGISASALFPRASLGASEAELVSGLEIERRLVAAFAADGLDNWTTIGKRA